MEFIGNVYPTNAYLLSICAPTGFGLGTKAKHIDDLNLANACGWYEFNSDCVNNPFGYSGTLLVLNGNDAYFTQVAFAGSVALRNGSETSWEEWEYINPAMEPNVEYRTTEKWNGIPVYTAFVSMGVETNLKTEISAQYIIRHNGCAGGNSLPVISSNFADSSWANATITEDGYINVSVHLGSDMIGKDVGIRVWYTK